ncbi:MAG: hypothetical protein ACRDKW_01805, partial [Actinomycetota bacterium]
MPVQPGDPVLEAERRILEGTDTTPATSSFDMLGEPATAQPSPAATRSSRLASSTSATSTDKGGRVAQGVLTTTS